MKFLLSVNAYKMHFSPEELAEVCLNSADGELVGGFEAASFPDIDYLLRLAEICGERGLEFQVHGDSARPAEEQAALIRRLHTEAAQKIGRTVNLTLHPLMLTGNTVAENVAASKEYFLKVADLAREALAGPEETSGEACDNGLAGVRICIENLNRVRGYDNRVPVEEAAALVAELGGPFSMTLDMGHEISDAEKVLTPPRSVWRKIKNVHFHAYDENGDHQPVRADSKHLDELTEAARWFSEAEYDGNVVLEYDFWQFAGGAKWFYGPEGEELRHDPLRCTEFDERAALAEYISSIRSVRDFLHK